MRLVPLPSPELQSVMPVTPAIKESAVPRRRPDVESVGVGDRSILHDRRDGRVHGLSHSAAVIWDRCDGRVSVAGMARELAGILDRPAPAVLDDVAAGVADLAARGLLTVEAADVLVAPEGRGFAVGFDGDLVAVRIDAPGGARLLEELFHRMPPGRATRCVGGVALEDGEGGGWRVVPEEERYPATDRLPDALGLAKRAVVDRFVGARPDLVWLHAGAVCHGDRALVFAGGWGSGKTTFVTALAERGWKYLSDDVVAVDPAADRVLPFPLAPQPRTSPGAEVAKERVRDLPRRIVRLDADRIREEPARIAAFVLPVHDPDGDGEPVPVDPVQAAMQLASHRLDRDPGGASFRHIARLAGSLPAFRVQYSETGPAVDALSLWAAEDPGKAGARDAAARFLRRASEG